MTAWRCVRIGMAAAAMLVIASSTWGVSPANVCAAAKNKIEALRQSIDDLKVKKAMAELTEMASGMVTEIGGSGDTLSRLHEMVETEREKAAGRVRVAKDSINTTDIQMKEAEQKALADQALAILGYRGRIILDMGGQVEAVVGRLAHTAGASGHAGAHPIGRRPVGRQPVVGTHPTNASRS